MSKLLLNFILFYSQFHNIVIEVSIKKTVARLYRSSHYSSKYLIYLKALTTQSIDLMLFKSHN